MGWKNKTKKKNRKKQQQPFSLLVLQKTLIPKAAQLLFWCSRLWDFFPPLLLLLFFVVFFKSPHHTLWHIGYNTTKQYCGCFCIEGKKMIIRCVDGGHSQAGSKIKASPRLAYVKKTTCDVLDDTPLWFPLKPQHADVYLVSLPSSPFTPLTPPWKKARGLGTPPVNSDWPI